MADTERSCHQIFARTLKYQPINRAPCIIIIIIIQLNNRGVVHELSPILVDFELEHVREDI